tara:strand:+ start:165 stop:1460 length:1296 start_codon:yes stop_codon:yes gene_type:complete
MSFDAKSIKGALQKAKRPELARILSGAWNISLSEYSERLWETTPAYPPLEAELRLAFVTEFRRIGFTEWQAQSYSSALEKSRILQTATHLTASEGPTFLALHNLALLGIPQGKTYFVGSYSGVPFANSAWSGCLNFSNYIDLESVISVHAPGFSELKRADNDRVRDSSDRRISLIPGNMRDVRVFQSRIPEKMADLMSYFSEPILGISPKAKTGDDFTKWASQFCTNQLGKNFPSKSIIYFDLNEVISNYLALIFANSNHPIYRLFFDNAVRNSVFAVFPSDTPLFTVNVNYKNKIRQESVVLNGDKLHSQNYMLNLTQENLINEIKSGVLCPGLFLGFTALSFINEFICFGSFEQVEYLTGFKQKWLKLDLLDNEIVHKSNTSAFTSGRCVDESGEGIHPLDLVLGMEMKFNGNQTVGELIQPLLYRLLK